MVDDARFEDGAEAPVALRALEAADVPVISALIQDAVFPITEMTWAKSKRRFAILLNRYRWERPGAAPKPERVQSVLVVEDVAAVRSQGVDRAETELVLSCLAIEWTAGEDGQGTLTLILAGDGAVALDVEALEVTLKDVTRPYMAPSGRTPDHGA